MLNDLDRRTLCCHAGFYLPPLAPVYLDVEHTLSVGAAIGSEATEVSSLG